MDERKKEKRKQWNKRIGEERRNGKFGIFKKWLNFMGFVIWVVNILPFCYIYENFPIFISFFPF